MPDPVPENDIVTALRTQLREAKACIEALRGSSRHDYTDTVPDSERGSVRDANTDGHCSFPTPVEITALVRDSLWHDCHTSTTFFKHRILSLRMSGNRLLVQLDINGITARCLLDSGATLSCVSGDFAARHPASLGSRTVLANTVTPVEVADSRSVRCLSTLPEPCLSLPSGDRCQPVALHVMQLPSKIDCILGVDWLRRNKVSMDFDDTEVATITIGDRVLSAAATRTRLLPPMHVSYMNARTVELFDRRDLDRVIAPNDPVLCYVHTTVDDDSPHLVPPSQQHRVDKLQAEFAAAFTEPSGVPVRPFHYEMDIPLLPNARLPPPRNFEVPMRQQQVLTDWLDNCVHSGWVREQRSPVNSPVFCVPKANGGWRIVCDFRGTNSVSQNFYQSNIESTTRLVERLAEAKILSKGDAQDGFYQLPLKKEDQYLTAFTVNRRQYVFTVLPQGLKNGPIKFQGLINTVLRRHGLHGDVQLRTLLPFMQPEVARRYEGWDPGTVVGVSWAYVDDLVAGTLFDDMDLHEAHVRALLTACVADDIHLRFSKCAFFQREIAFLGQVVGNGVARIDPSKTAVVAAWATLTKVREVQAFLGFCNFFRRHISGFSEIAAPLYRLTRKQQGWSWSYEHQLAFERLRTAVSTAPVLRLPLWDRPFVVITDCSAVAMGAALMQADDAGHLLPVCYFSETLKGSELNYSARDLEALALTRAVVHFRFYLWGAPFQIKVLSDHRSLQHLRTQRDLHGRIGRWQDILSEFDYSISYYPGRQNVIADFLSRHPARTPVSSRTHVREVIEHLSGLADDVKSPDAAPTTLRVLPGLLAPVLTRLQTQRAMVRDLLADSTELFAMPVDEDGTPAVSPPPLLTDGVRAEVPPPSTDHAHRDAPVPLTDTDLSVLHHLDYSSDKDFAPIVELFDIIDSDHELREVFRTRATQLDPVCFPPRLRKFLPKLQWYRFLPDRRLYNLTTDSIALVIPNTTIQVEGQSVLLREHLMSHFHDARLSAHRGSKPTYLRLRRHCYWHRMGAAVEGFVRSCEVCHRSKSRTAKPFGLMEAPTLPSAPAQSYTMDFMFDLAPDPLTQCDGIMAVIDRFSSWTRLLALHSTCTAQTVAELLEKEIFLKRGYPWEIICDRDPRFTSRYFEDFARSRGFRLAMCSGDHPESDGKSERRFRTLEEAIRCYIDHGQTNVFQMLGELEFALNDSPDAVTRMSAFLQDKGYNLMRPVDLASVPFAPVTVQSVQDHWDTVQSSWAVARDAVRQAQSQYVYQANKHRRVAPLTLFAVGQLVYVSRYNFVPPAMRDQPTRKFQPRFFGPYRILKQVSATSYRVELPANVRTHPVFHASRLKPFTVSARFPHRRATRMDPVIIDGTPEYHVEQILKKRKHYSKFQYLVKWSGYPLSDASWEPAQVIKEDLPEMVEEFERDHVSGAVTLLQDRPITYAFVTDA